MHSLSCHISCRRLVLLSVFFCLPTSAVSCSQSAVLSESAGGWQYSQPGKDRGGGVCIFVNERWCTKIHPTVWVHDLGLLTDNYYVIVYHNSISHFTQWWMVNSLELNVDNTKELVIYIAHTPLAGLVPTSISNKTVEQVSHSRYLRLTMDNKTAFDQHLTNIYKWSQPSLVRFLFLPTFCYRHSKASSKPSCCTALPVSTTCSPPPKKKAHQDHTHCLPNHPLPTPNLCDLNHKAVVRLAHTIANDSDHPLNPHFTLLPSGCRYRALKCRRARFSKSFVPSARAALNNLRANHVQ